MFWPLVLPFKITFWSLIALIAFVTLLAPTLQWKRGKTFLISVLLACVVFVPSCTGIMKIVNSQRFGVFQYEAFADVNDFRVARYLPTKSRHITVDQFAMGHRAKYSISEADLTEYLDDLWNRHGKQSAIARDRLNEGTRLKAEDFAHEYGDLGWPPLENATTLHSPVEPDGGSATYYFDRSTGTAYHRAGYW